MIYPRRVLHITVSADGSVATWDNRDRALLGKGVTDVYVPFLLSLSQTERLKQAQEEAAKEKSKNEGG